MTIDLNEKFKNRVIEGIEEHDLQLALLGESEAFKVQDDSTILHVPSGKRIVLDCAYAYFEPVKSYYKPSKTSSCNYVQRSMGVDVGDHACRECILACLRNKLKVKPRKIAVSREYYKK